MREGIPAAHPQHLGHSEVGVLFIAEEKDRLCLSFPGQRPKFLWLQYVLPVLPVRLIGQHIRFADRNRLCLQILFREEIESVGNSPDRPSCAEHGALSPLGVNFLGELQHGLAVLPIGNREGFCSQIFELGHILVFSGHPKHGRYRGLDIVGPLLPVQIAAADRFRIGDAFPIDPLRPDFHHGASIVVLQRLSDAVASPCHVPEKDLIVLHILLHTDMPKPQNLHGLAQQSPHGRAGDLVGPIRPFEKTGGVSLPPIGYQHRGLSLQRHMDLAALQRRVPHIVGRKLIRALIAHHDPVGKGDKIVRRMCLFTNFHLQSPSQ